MPFSDPMADGPSIQESSTRSIENGTTIQDIFELVKKIRTLNNEIPVIFNGILYILYLIWELKSLLLSAFQVGVDGLIIVDLQPEEDADLYVKTKQNNIDLIRLITPTTNKERLKTILYNASGFLYYVTVTGITGQNSANLKELEASINLIRSEIKPTYCCCFWNKKQKRC